MYLYKIFATDGMSMKQDCPKLSECPFFNGHLGDQPSTSGLYKKRYCLSDYSKCARFIVSEKLGPSSVPADLYPNEIAKVPLLLKRND